MGSVLKWWNYVLKALIMCKWNYKDGCRITFPVATWRALQWINELLRTHVQVCCVSKDKADDKTRQVCWGRGLICSETGEGSVAGFCLNGDETEGVIKRGECIDYCLVKDSASCRGNDDYNDDDDGKDDDYITIMIITMMILMIMMITITMILMIMMITITMIMMMMTTTIMMLTIMMMVMMMMMMMILLQFN